MNPLRQIIRTSFLVGGAVLATAASGQTQGYVQKTRTINAAVLLLDSDKPNGYKYGQTGAPFAFYNLDQATGIKPDGWTFVNPFAPGIVTTDTIAHFQELFAPNPAALRTPDQNAYIGKRQAAYWEVQLSQLSEAQLQSYNVLLIAPRTSLSLNALERERLRRFVDGGGVLWVDLFGANGTTGYQPNGPNGFTLPLDVALGAGGSLLRSDSTDPVLNGPRMVTDSDLALLVGQSSPATISIAPVQAKTLNDVPSAAEFFRFKPVVTVSSNLPIVSEARLGDGAIVVTSFGAAMLLNQGQASAADTRGTAATTFATTNINYDAAGPALNPTGRAAARMAVNIVNLGSNYEQPNGGPHKTGSASTDPGSPVLPRFTAEGTYGPPGNQISGAPEKDAPPVSYKGFLVATIGNRVVVYDAVPGRDLDGDGDPDDGIANSSGQTDDTLRDTSIGRTTDLVWASDNTTMTGPLSSPVCVSLPDAKTNLPTDQILVTDSTGTLFAYPLVKSTANFRIQGSGVTPLYSLAPPNGVKGQHLGNTPNSPAVMNGIAYMADVVTSGSSQAGRVWMADLTQGARINTGGANDWTVGGTFANSLPLFTASPTVGAIPMPDRPGGSDLVLYVPGVFGTNTQPGFVSLWLGAKGEAPQSVVVDGGSGTQLRITTRAGAAGQLPIYLPVGTTGSRAIDRLGVHLTITDKDGNPVATSAVLASDTPTQSTAKGELDYTLNKSFTQDEINAYTFRVDYTIDWGDDPATYTGPITRGQLTLPVAKSPQPDQTKRILGPIAMTSRGTLHMVEATPGSSVSDAGGTSGGTYWAIREDVQRGQFRVLSRFTLNEIYQQTVGASGTSQRVPQTFEDVDGLQTYVSLLGSLPNFTDFTFSGGVALHNGSAFVGVNANRNGIIPVAIVAAFKAEPETAQINVGTGLGANPTLIQADFQRTFPGNSGRTPVQSRLSGDRLSYDQESGVLRIESLAQVTRNEIVDCISESQPVLLGTDSTAYTLIYPEANGGHWSPLLWFGLWNGGKIVGPPLVAGNEVFIAANTTLPDILINKKAPKDAKPVAVLWSIDADAPTTGQYAGTLVSRPWMVQQMQLLPQSAGFSASPYYRMPQNRGATTYSGWLVRLNQTKLGASDDARGVGGGGGVVAAWGDNGLYGLSQADFLVADEGRLLTVDSSGNPVRNTFGGRFSGIGNGGSVANYRPLVRPVRAYPVGTTDTLVVDAGANRVVRMSQEGLELRSIDRMHLDIGYKPSAYVADEPLTFNDPRDATTWEGYQYMGPNPVVTGQQTVEYWIHYLIADGGNHRVVELIDRFQVDPTTGVVGAPIQVNEKDPVSGVTHSIAQVGVLAWQSPSLQQTTTTGDYYNSVSRVFVGQVGSTTNPSRYVYVTGVSRSRPTQSAAGLDTPNPVDRPTAGSGGAVVVFDPLGGTHVLNRFTSPDLSATPFLVYDQDQPSNSQNRNPSPYSTPSRVRPFTDVRAVTASTVATITGGTVTSSVRLMVTDADAVYEFNLDSAQLGNPNLDPLAGTKPSWMINEAAFRSLRPDNNYGLNARSFRPTYARRLESGDVIIVNGYQGTTLDRSAAYNGEVVLLDGSIYNPLDLTPANLGFTLDSVHFELPPITGIRGLQSPVFADRR